MNIAEAIVTFARNEDEVHELAPRRAIERPEGTSIWIDYYFADNSYLIYRRGKYVAEVGVIDDAMKIDGREG